MNWLLFTPELSMLAAAAVFLLLACLRPDPNRAFLVAVAAGAVVVIICLSGSRLQGELFDGSYRVDLYSQVFKTLLALGYLLVISICRNLDGVAPERHGEFFLLTALGTLAMMLMASGIHLLVIYLALELSSYTLYILVFIRREANRGLLSGLSYFLVGISTSAIMLFGMALVYAVTGTLHLDELAALPPDQLQVPLLAAGILLTLGGFFFKLAVFPFHFWAPEAYEGAPHQVAAFISTASKVAAVAVLARVVAPLQGMDLLVRAMICLAVASMTVGNLCAIAQKDFKRLMAFSSIAHAGYLLIGILCMSPKGNTGIVFYAAAVLVLKFTCFMVLAAVAENGRNMRIDELAGLHRRSPLLALALMMALFGLAGIPPTVGFSGKFLIFTAAIEQGYLTLVLIAMVNVVISLYYYLLVLKAAYLDKPEEALTKIELAAPFRILAMAMIAAIVALGIYPTLLYDLAIRAAQCLQ